MKKEMLLKLAKKYGTPLYVYNGDLIVEKYNTLKKAISWPKLKLHYAMKANYNPHILKLLEKEGSCIDAVSPGDVILALKCGFSKDRIIFTANKISDNEMHQVKKLGVLFNIGSLSRLEKFGKAYPNTEICIRFNPDVVAGHHERVRTGGEASKFGIFLNKIEQVKEICNKYNLKVIGIHEHTGSGIPESVQIMAGIKNILKIVKKEHWPHLRFVDFGGGFKVSYKPNEKEVNYTKFGEEVVKLFSKTCQGYGKKLEMYFEPGRYIVAEAGYLLVEATTLKHNPNKMIAGTNSGFPQLIRPMFYQAYHKISNLSNPNGKKKKYDITGNICESGDCFAVNRLLPEIKEGNILAIETAGAYCYSMGGVYNLRPMPPEVLVKNNKDRLIRKGLSSKELIEKIIKETI